MKKLLLIIASLGIGIMLQAQTSATVNETTAGTLTTLLSSLQKSSVDTLTLTGTIDARDFVTMRDSMPNLAVIDMSGTTIIDYNGTLGTAGKTSTDYPANAFPKYAFYNNIIATSKTSLTSIVLPASVTSIGYNTFYYCLGLTSVTIPASVKSIGDNAFDFCSSLTSVTIPALVKSIGGSAFSWCSALINVDTNNPKYSSIDGILFNKLQDTLINCPTSITGNYTVPSTVTAIGTGAFGESSLTSLEIPQTVTSIGGSAFESSSLTSINIPSAVTSIKDGVFAGSKITSISIPSSITSIGNFAFDGCTSLTAIYAYPVIPIDLSTSPGVFQFVDTTTCTLYVPASSKAAYQAANQWKAFTHIVETGPATYTTITASACGSYTLNGSTYTATGTYTQTLKNVSGGDSVITLNLTVNSLPTVTASASASPICQGTTITVSAGGASSYVWNNGIGAVASTTVFPKGTTTYMVTGTDGNGCSNMASTTVLVNPFPTVSIIDLDTATMPPFTGALLATGAATYKWGTGQTDSSIAVSVKISTTYSVTGTDVNGCTGTASLYIYDCVKPSSQTLSLSTNPTSNMICPGGTAVLTTNKLTPVIVEPLLDFLWYKGANVTTGTPVKATINTTTATSYSDSYIVPFAEAGLYTVLVRGHNKNIYTPQACWETANVTITANAAPSYTIGSGGYYCSVATPPTVPIKLYGTAPFSFTWNDGTSSHAVTSSVSPYNVSVTATSTVTLTYLNDANCVASTFSGSAKVTKIQQPDFKWDYTTDTVYCAGNNTSSLAVIEETAIQSTDKGNVFNWSFLPNNSSTVTALNAGYYYVTVTNQDKGANKTCTQLMGPRKIVMNPLPTISTMSTQALITNGESSILTAFGANSYIWSNGVVTASQTVSPTTSTVYTVTGTDGNGCSDTVSTLVTVTMPTVSDTINVAVAGSLSTLLTTNQKDSITQLTLTGTIDARDFEIMRDSMPNLSVIDVSGATIAAYTGTKGTYFTNDSTATYPANTIPQYAFYNQKSNTAKTSLTAISLPFSATSIGGSAFEDCSGLTSINIPSSVTSIGTFVFYNCSGLTSVNIPSSITSIGEFDFAYCSGLTSVSIPSSVTSIKENAFMSCKNITWFTIPNSVISIGSGAFMSCNGLTSVSIPSSVTTLGTDAFAGCENLTSVSIPSSVTSISQGVFDQDTHLASIYAYATTPVDLSSSPYVFFLDDTTTCTLYVPAGSKAEYDTASQWKAFTHIVEMGPATYATITTSACGSYTLNDSIYTASGTYTQTLINVSGSDSVITLKLTVYPLPTISASATPDTISTGASSILLASGGTSYTWSNGVTTASQTVSPTASTMYMVTGTDGNGCSDTTSMVVSVIMPTVSDTINVAVAGSLSTLLTTNQKDSIIQLTLTGTIDARDFVTMRDSMPNLTSIDLSGATIVDYNGTLGTAGTSSTDYPANAIPQNAFYNAYGTSKIILTSIALPSSATAIGDYAFFYCSSLKSTIIPSSVTNIGYNAFADCSGLTSVVIPSSVTAIGIAAFTGCSGLTSVSIPSSVTTIGDEAFWSCFGLTSVIIPSSVTAIGGGVFSGCWGLTSVYANSGTPIDLSASSGIFDNVDTSTCILYVPAGSKAEYDTAYQWKAFTHIVEVGTVDSSTITTSACGSYTLNDSTYTASGIYTQTLINVSGGDSTITLNLTIYPLPTITVTATPDTISIGASSILLASGGTSYNWSNGVTTAEQTVSPTTSTQYAVTGTGANGCSDEVDMWVSVWVGTWISHADSIKAIDKSWRAAYRVTEHPKVVTFDFTDSLICPEKNTAGTAVVYQHPAGTQHNCGLNYIDYEPLGGAATTLRTYFSPSDDSCLRVDYDQSANIATQGSSTVAGVGTDNWQDVMKTYWVQKVQPAAQVVPFNPFKDTTMTPTAANPHQRAVPGDSIVGVMLDLTDTAKRLITITYQLIGLPQTDSADIRFDLYDVNGRSTCGHSTKRCIGRPALGDNDGSFHQITFSWANLEGVPWAQGPGMVMGPNDGDLNDEDQKDFSDGYQSTWFNLPNGRGFNGNGANTVGPVGEQGLFDFSNAAVFYPASGGGNSALTGDAWDIPIDAAHIIGFGFMINDGPSVLYHTPKFSLLIRSIIIGDDSQLGTCGEYIFGQGSAKGAVAGSQCPQGLVSSILVTDTSNASIDTIGGHIQLFATVIPSNATNKEITWYSVTPAGIATISSTGVLTANGTKNGIVTVTANATDGSGTTGSEQIAITNQVKLIVHDEAIGAICVGDNVQFDASAFSGVVWTSSDTSIATIDYTGMLIAKAVGTVTITGSMLDGSLLPGSETITIGTTLPADSSTITASACGSYTLNDSTYTASGIYTQTLKNVAGGDSVITLHLTVYTYPLPMISVTATTDSIAIGANVVLTASGGSSFTWSDGDTTASQTVSPKTSTTYYVTVVDGYGCIDSASKTIAVASLVFESVTITNGGTMLLVTLNTDIQLYAGIEYDFIVTINDTLKAYVIDAVTQVMKDGSNQNVLLLQLATPLPAGASVIISYAPVNPETGLASALSSFTLKTATGVAITKQSVTKLYPNPAQTNITVQASELHSVSVYTIQGQCVATVLASNETATLSVASLPAGMYVAELITASETIRRAFIKE